MFTHSEHSPHLHYTYNRKTKDQRNDETTHTSLILPYAN